MDHEARKKSFWSRLKVGRRKAAESPEDQPGRTGELQLRPASADGLRSAVDTADYLIVHDKTAPPTPANGMALSADRLKTLRERVDTGDYAIHVDVVAEAMVERVKRIQKDRSED